MGTPKIELLHMDCMEYMAGLPDKAFDLAIVDPPYQIERFSKNMDSQGTLGKSIFMGKNKISEWDVLPTEKYFSELVRVSNNQIIWGANHFWKTANLENATNFIFWDKKMPFPNFSRGELAWTSFPGVCKCFEYPYYGNTEGKGQCEGRIHPTQKPVALYEWLLTNYATCKTCKNQGGYYEDVAGDGGMREWIACTDCCRADRPFKILDTHLGSGSSAIAAHNLGFDFVGCELDEDYYKAAVERFNKHKAQQRLFAEPGDGYDKVDRDYARQGDLL